MPEKDFYQVSLKAILKNHEGKVLVLRNPSGGVSEGFYDLPGGRIDVNEFEVPWTDILRRELEEELQLIDITIVPTPVALGRHEIPSTLTKDGRSIHVLYIFFEAMLNSGVPAISAEHLSARWVDLQKIMIDEYFMSGILQGVEMYLSDGNSKK